MKVGVLVGREWSWPPAFLDAVNARSAATGVTAEYAVLGGSLMDEPCPYAVLIDRISHEVPYYRSYLKNAVLQGTHVINNPFMWTADDKYFGSTLATKLGVAHPKTVALPNKNYVPGIVPSESLRNLAFPLDWDRLIRYIGGFPCILKDAHGGGWKGVYVCHDMAELWRSYDESGLMTMVLQEFIRWEGYVRCMCLGREEVLVMPYDPHQRRYLVDPAYLGPELRERIVGDCLKLVRALGYDMNTVEFAVRGGIPYAIDFMNPAPDMDVNSLTPTYYQWCVEHMTDLAIKLASSPRRQLAEIRWGELF